MSFEEKVNKRDIKMCNKCVIIAYNPTNLEKFSFNIETMYNGKSKETEWSKR